MLKYWELNSKNATDLFEVLRLADTSAVDYHLEHSSNDVLGYTAFFNLLKLVYQFHEKASIVKSNQKHHLSNVKESL